MKGNIILHLHYTHFTAFVNTFEQICACFLFIMPNTIPGLLRRKSAHRRISENISVNLVLHKKIAIFFVFSAYSIDEIGIFIYNDEAIG